MKQAIGYYQMAQLSIIKNSDAVGVKGNAETTYRTGLVNLTPVNIGSPTIADLTSETNTRIANEGKLYSLDFNGALWHNNNFI